MELPKYQKPVTEDPLLKKLELLPTATLHEAMERSGDLPSLIKPISPDMKIVGRAVTVATPGRSNLLIHKAIYEALPGDVLVVDADGFYDAGYWGEIMNTAAIVRNLAGLVINAGVRDSEILEQQAFPVFSRCVSYRGTEKYPGGTINESLHFSGTVVMSGDYIVGDQDGVVVIPQQSVTDVIGAAEARELKEQGVISQILGGKSTLEIYGF